MKRVNNTFYEYQQLKRWLIFSIFIPVNLMLITGCIIQIVFGKPLGNNPIPDKGFIILSALMLLLMVIMLCYNLIIVIDRDGIHISTRIFPFYTKSKSFLWDDISDIVIKKYSPFRTLGWGLNLGTINLSMSFGKMRYPTSRGIIWGFNKIAYTMYGNKGVQFVYKNKRIVLIGTNNPDELSEVLQELCKSVDNKE